MKAKDYLTKLELAERLGVTRRVVEETDAAPDDPLPRPGASHGPVFLAGG